MKKLILFFMLNHAFLNTNEVAYIDLWLSLKQRLTIDYVNDFSNQDVEAYLDYFAPNEKINIYQYGQDASGKGGKGKTIKIYSGNWFSSIIRGRLPARLMAKTLFSRLKNQDYKKSKIKLLGISKQKNQMLAYARFERINNSGNIYQSARGLYTLIHTNNDWHIVEISTYDDNENTDTLVDYESMWNPDKSIND